MARLEDRKRWRLLVPMRLCRMQSTSIHPGQPSLFLILSYTTDLMHSFLRGVRIANDSVLVSESIELLLLGDFWLLRLTGSGLSRSTSLDGEERNHRLERKGDGFIYRSALFRLNPKFRMQRSMRAWLQKVGVSKGLQRDVGAGR